MNIPFNSEQEPSAEDHTETSMKIEEGLASAARGELLDADEVRFLLENKKRAFLSARAQRLR